ncbi:hypothetical protein [Frankia gtarii]|uniref:hypothetical protein n=1 Tax=Frankia gtarii TaxID=2950102 RepID=UPI0021BFD870|nr:hypothetical protein [Frankia gtarii]
MTAPTGPHGSRVLTVEAGALYQAVGAALPHASNDPTLLVLGTVLLDVVDGVFRAVATNKYTVGVAVVVPKLDSRDPRLRFLLEKADAARLIRQVKADTRRKPHTPVNLEVIPGAGELHRLTVRTQRGPIFFDEAEGRFPTVDGELQFSGERLALGEIAFNPDLLHCFRKSRVALDEQDQSLQLRFRGAALPVDVQIGARFRGLICPIRIL